MDGREFATDFVELYESFVGVYPYAKHLSEHRDADLEPYAGEKSNEHGLGEKIGDEAEFEQARDEQKSSGEQRDQPCKRHIACAGSGRHSGQSAAKNGRSRGVGGDNEITRRAKGCERE